jgi:hypothetical protein
MCKNKTEIDDCVGCRTIICGEETHQEKVRKRPLDAAYRALINEVDDADDVMGDTKDGEEITVCRTCSKNRTKKKQQQDQASSK